VRKFIVPTSLPKLKDRVTRAAEAALTRQHHVSAVDVLCGMGLLAPTHLVSWRQGRVDYLEQVIQGKGPTLTTSLALFHQWAHEKGLVPSPTEPTRNTRTGAVPLRFTADGDPAAGKQYSDRYVSADLSERRRQNLEKKAQRPQPPSVFDNLCDSECFECGVAIEKGERLFLEAGQPLCLACAGLGDLEYLPSGNVTLTRRATRFSQKTAVVVRFSRSRGRYERQGLLVEAAALEQAEQSCLEDAAERAALRVRAAEQRRKQDRVFVQQLVERLADLFPGCPPAERTAIAEHTAVRGSGRVGRSEAGRALEQKAMTAAVIAAIRHRHTNYDALLASGVERAEARRQIADAIDRMLSVWRP
jgi:hypothetical protein